MPAERIDAGYVPPPVPARTRQPAPAARPSPTRPSPPSRRQGIRGGAIGTLLILGAAALVIVLVVLPLMNLDGNGGNGGNQPSASPIASSVPTAQPGVVPDTVGLPTDEAIDLATEAGLDWTVRCNQDPDEPEGIIDQEPPAGTEVAPGSQFTMFSARIEDCR